MDTKVRNNIVEPRSYQLYGDEIESKQAVEPISIVAGTGPICGFNYIDISTWSEWYNFVSCLLQHLLHAFCFIGIYLASKIV